MVTDNGSLIGHPKKEKKHQSEHKCEIMEDDVEASQSFFFNLKK